MEKRIEDAENKIAVDIEAENTDSTSNIEKDQFTFEGRSALSKSILTYLVKQKSFVDKKYQQLRFLNRVIEIDFSEPLYTPDLTDSFGDELNNLDLDDIFSAVIEKSNYIFHMDIPFKRIQDIKLYLKKKENLDIREALVLKLLGIDVIESEDYQFDTKAFLYDIWNFQYEDILDFIVILFPSKFNDYSICYQFIPDDFGRIKNEAFTSEEILSSWFSIFKNFDFDLSSNALSNIFIGAQYWSLLNPFFPKCDVFELEGNILCNPPYPISENIENLIINILRNIERIKNMLIILPYDEKKQKASYLSSFYNLSQSYSHKFRKIDCNKFRQNEVVDRHAQRYRMSLIYIGVHAAEFERNFEMFSNETSQSTKSSKRKIEATK